MDQDGRRCNYKCFPSHTSPAYSQARKIASVLVTTLEIIKRQIINLFRYCTNYIFNLLKPNGHVMHQQFNI